MASKHQRPRSGNSVMVAQHRQLPRPCICSCFALSGVINLLALTGSFYMLQIYDRALTSGSVPTLVALSVLAIGLYLFQGLFDVLRSQILVRFGARLDAKLAPLAHQVAIEMPRYGYSTSEALERGRDVDTVRGFVGQPGPDRPVRPAVDAAVPGLRLPAPSAARAADQSPAPLVLIALTDRHRDLMTALASAEMHRAASLRNNIADSHARNADILKAMGFGGRAVDALRRRPTHEHLTLQTQHQRRQRHPSAASRRCLRMMLQSALLGLGAYLTIKGEMSAGAIIACSVASARALAPDRLAIGNWKGIVAARRSFRPAEGDAGGDGRRFRSCIDLPAPTPDRSRSRASPSSRRARARVLV